jgi:hypothetical protein
VPVLTFPEKSHSDSSWSNIEEGKGWQIISLDTGKKDSNGNSITEKYLYAKSRAFVNQYSIPLTLEE